MSATYDSVAYSYIAAKQASRFQNTIAAPAAQWIEENCSSTYWCSFPQDGHVYR
jgi:hypothetical protein